MWKINYLDLSAIGRVSPVIAETCRQLWAGGMDVPQIYMFWATGHVGMAKGEQRSPADFLSDSHILWERLESREQGNAYKIEVVEGLDVDVRKEATREFTRWKQLAKGHPGGRVPIARVKPKTE